MQNLAITQVQSIRWQDDRLWLLDQRLLPVQEIELEFNDAPAVAAAIRDMVVRGAPAIGIAAAYGVVLSVKKHAKVGTADWYSQVQRDMQTLRAARPTAINLHWALDRMDRAIQSIGKQDPAAV
ncbi:MAG TPA: S-methyl-5-thioribose-1-phosphate isomerase, partial [Gammaproteobacteria bacterium]